MIINQRINNRLFSRLGLLIVVAGLALLQPIFSHAAYSEPSGLPPNYTTTETPQLLNGSTVAQRKLGSLLIGPVDSTKCNLTSTNPVDQEGCAKLCLNPNLTAFPGVSDISGTTPACVISWNQVAGSLINGTALVRKLTDPTHQDFATANPSDTVDNGAFSLQAAPYTLQSDAAHTYVVNPYAQLISLMAEAPASASRTDSLRPTGIIADAQTSSNFAAQFSGRFAVVSDESVPHEICLNSPNGVTNCITDWSQISVGQDPTLVRLQNVSTNGSRTADIGSTVASGALVTEALVAGVPAAGTQLSYTCGDGICSAGFESPLAGAQYCPEDCQ